MLKTDKHAHTQNKMQTLDFKTVGKPYFQKYKLKHKDVKLHLPKNQQDLLKHQNFLEANAK